MRRCTSLALPRGIAAAVRLGAWAAEGRQPQRARNRHRRVSPRRALGASPGLVGAAQRYSVFARLASTPSAAQAPRLRSPAMTAIGSPGTRRMRAKTSSVTPSRRGGQRGEFLKQRREQRGGQWAIRRCTSWTPSACAPPGWQHVDPSRRRRRCRRCGG